MKIKHKSRFTDGTEDKKWFENVGHGIETYGEVLNIMGEKTGLLSV